MGTRRSWILGGLGAALLVFGLLPVPDGLQGRSVCMFRNLFDLPCPGCGMTRSLRACMHGDWAAAWEFNPFGFVLVAIGVVLLLAPLWERLKPGWDLVLIGNRWVRVVGITIAAAMLIHGVLRILHQLSGRS